MGWLQKICNKKQPFIIGDIVRKRTEFHYDDPVIANFLNSPHKVMNVVCRGLFKGWAVYIEDAEGFGFHAEILELVKS